MAESTLSISFNDLKIEVGHFLGYGPNAADWTAAQLAEIDRIVQTGVRRFYYPPAVEGVQADFEWSFIKPETTIATVADQATNDLPDNLGRVVGQFYYPSSSNRVSVVVVSEAQLNEYKSHTDSDGAPRYCCIRHKASDGSDGQRLEVEWYPVPDSAYTLTYKFEAYQGRLSNSNPYPLGGMKHGELVMESCLAVAEERANDEKGIHYQNFMAQLITAIALDRRQGAINYGKMGQPEEHDYRLRRGDTGGTYPITYNGDVIT
jgi:hypothetical protein